MRVSKKAKSEKEADYQTYTKKCNSRKYQYKIGGVSGSTHRRMGCFVCRMGCYRMKLERRGLDLFVGGGGVDGMVGMGDFVARVLHYAAEVTLVEVGEIVLVEDFTIDGKS